MVKKWDDRKLWGLKKCEGIKDFFFFFLFG